MGLLFKYNRHCRIISPALIKIRNHLKYKVLGSANAANREDS